MRLKVENNAFRMLLAFGFPNVKYEGTTFFMILKSKSHYQIHCILKKFMQKNEKNSLVVLRSSNFKFRRRQQCSGQGLEKHFLIVKTFPI